MNDRVRVGGRTHVDEPCVDEDEEEHGVVLIDDVASLVNPW